MKRRTQADQHGAAFAERFGWTPPEPAPHLRPLFRELMRAIVDRRLIVISVPPKHGMAALYASLGAPRPTKKQTKPQKAARTRRPR